MSSADRPAVGGANDPAVGGADRPAVSGADRPAVGGQPGSPYRTAWAPGRYPSILVIDVGTSGVRSAIVRLAGEEGAGIVEHVHHQPVLPASPAPGIVEIDARVLAEAALATARSAMADAGERVDAVGIANQRASTIVWDREGHPVGPGIGWQDLRTVGTCLALQADGFRFAPNASATKLAAILDAVDPDRVRSESPGDLHFGTVDTWLVWILTGGAHHVTDATNAGLTGLLRADGTGWDERALEALRIPGSILPRIVDSAGPIAEATALPGSPPITGMAGDQQASLVGQGCTRAGLAKATFGTGGMLDLCTGKSRVGFAQRGSAGTIPVIAWRHGTSLSWGVEAIMLAAGTNVEWLRDDLRIIDNAEESDAIAASCAETGDVWYVPALLGLGTPVWDFGARGTLLGISRGTGRPEIVRAVLEGVAHRGADLLEAAGADAGEHPEALRVDGGMTGNSTFLQALADACHLAIEVAPVTEATTLGAAYLAGLGLGYWPDAEALSATWHPRLVIDPDPSIGDDAWRHIRERWHQARSRAERTIPELSGIDF